MAWHANTGIVVYGIVSCRFVLCLVASYCIVVFRNASSGNRIGVFLIGSYRDVSCCTFWGQVESGRVVSRGKAPLRRSTTQSVQYNTIVPYRTVRYRAVQCSAEQYRTGQYRTVPDSIA